jgi:branched-chain amino acid transport system ATP-binding protein
MLAIENITKQFGGLVAVDDVNIHVAPKTIHSIIGPNGAGKTTLFNVLTGVYKPEHGVVKLEGHRISGRLPEHIAARGVGRTFQNIRLFGSMKVFENVLVGAHGHTRYNYFDALFQTPRYSRGEKVAREKALELLEYTGLKHRVEELARNLPYGEQRRLEIARALAVQPKLLLLDEPAAGMNPSESVALKDLIRKIRDELGITIVLIEHHMQVVMEISDRVTVLDYGKKIAEGTPAEIRDNPEVIEAYLGSSALKK